MPDLNFNMKKQENSLVFQINPLIYPPEAIYLTCLAFIDRAFLFLDGNPKKEVFITIKGKKKLTGKELKNLAGEFNNELLNAMTRITLGKRNQKIREYIISRALLSALGESDIEDAQEESQYKKDPLGIAVPWEEKYGPKRKNRSPHRRSNRVSGQQI